MVEIRTLSLRFLNKIMEMDELNSKEMINHCNKLVLSKALAHTVYIILVITNLHYL